MLDQRRRPILYAALGLVAAWLLAWAGYTIAKSSQITAAKVSAYLDSVDLDKLSGDARVKAIRELANKMNALTREERRRARLDRKWQTWFGKMSEAEKGGFMEMTLPTGYKQMLASFEELTPERRKRAINNALKRIQETRERMANLEPGEMPQALITNGPPMMSEELQKKAAMIGLKSFYTESSAQAKAELAPVLEELQRMMESGALLRARP